MTDFDVRTAGTGQETKETTKQQASQTMHETSAAAGEVAGTVREQARSVTDETMTQTRHVADQVRERVGGEANAQTQRFAGNLRQWADDLSAMAQQGHPETPVRQMVSQLADTGHRAADYLDERGMDGVMTEVQSYARRRPGAFLCGAALAGLIVGRMAKAGSASSRPAGGSSADSTTPAAQPGPDMRNEVS